MLHFTKDHLETASIEMDKYFLSEVVTKYTKEEKNSILLDLPILPSFQTLKHL